MIQRKHSVISKAWVTVTPKKMKWRSKVEKKYGVRKELAKYKKDIQSGINK